jgi:DNA-binding CsgD family transcriptional regulator
MSDSDALVLTGPIPSLVRWGCSPDADLVYRELVHAGPRPAGELARRLGLPTRRVRDALQELDAVDAADPYAAAGSARAEPQWRPRPHRQVLARLAARRARPPGRPVPVRQQLHLVSSLIESPVPDDHADVRHLPSRLATRWRLAELAAVERTERLAMNTERVFDPVAVRAGARMDRALLDRGVRVRVLGLHPAGQRPLYRAPDEPEDPRWSYREAASVPLKLLIVDRSVALFPVDPGNHERGYLEIARPSVVQALTDLFDRHWAQARDPREDDMPHIRLTARERTLIHLLAQGHTDATAARELQISPRSVTNILRALMDQLGVENRFQLGLALGALRVVEPPGEPGAARQHPRKEES